MIIKKNNEMDLKEGIKKVDALETNKLVPIITSIVGSGPILDLDETLYNPRFHYYYWLGDEKGEFIKYYNGVFHRKVSQNLNSMIRAYLREFGVSPTTKIVNEVRAELKTVNRLFPYQFDKGKTKEKIAFLNGLCVIKTGELIPYSEYPKDYRFVYIPHNYNPDYIYKVERDEEKIENSSFKTPRLYDNSCSKFFEFLDTFTSGTIEQRDRLNKYREEIDGLQMLLKDIEDVVTPEEYKELKEYKELENVAKKWSKLMLDVQNHAAEMRQSLVEIMGYCMTLSIDFYKAFIFTCLKSDTLKSAFINILIAAVGAENIHKSALWKIADTRFGKGPLASKIVNYYDDLPKHAVENSGVVKDLITANHFDYEKKNKDEDVQDNIIKLVFSCNGLPYVKDLDEAFCKRWVIIDCDHELSERPVIGDVDDNGKKWTKRNIHTWKAPYNPYISKREVKSPAWEKRNVIDVKEEMECAVACAMGANIALWKRGKFIGGSKKAVFERWRQEIDIIYKFICECCIKTDKTYECLIQRDMYRHFLRYIEIIGHHAVLKQNTFTKSMNKYGYTVGQTIRDDKHVSIYKGLKIDPNGPIGNYQVILDEEIILKTRSKKEISGYF